MKTKFERGMTGLEMAAAVAIVGLCGYLYTQVFAPGRNKKVADQIAVATAKADTQAQIKLREAYTKAFKNAQKQGTSAATWLVTDP